MSEYNDRGPRTGLLSLPVFPYLVGLAGLMLTTLAWHYASELADAERQARFAVEARSLAQTIQRKFEGHLLVLDGLAGLFAASNEVTRADFRAYLTRSKVRIRFPGIRRFGYCPYLTPGQLDKHIAKIRGEGFTDYRIQPPGQRSFYCPATYIEPFDEALKAFGSDILSEPVRRAAMEEARDTGYAVATDRLILLQDREHTKVPGFLLFVPVYRWNAPLNTVEERRAAITGFVFAAFRADELVRGILSRDPFPQLAFDWYDGETPEPDKLLHRYQPYPNQRRADMMRVEHLNVASHPWSFVITPDESFYTTTRRYQAPMVAVVGVIISALLFWATYLLGQNLRRRAEAERQARRLNQELELRVRQRTAELEAVNKELEAFSYSVSHDLRAPLRSIDGFSQALLEDYPDKLDATGQDFLRRVRAAAQRMGALIDDLLKLSRVTRSGINREPVNLSEIVLQVASDLAKTDPDREVGVLVEPNLKATADRQLITVALENLLNNAWKFTSRTPRALIEFGHMTEGDQTVYFIKDNGAGFDMQYVEKLFVAFQRLHGLDEFPGTGIGLATVQRVIRRHGGRIWAEGREGAGATFYFTL